MSAMEMFRQLSLGADGSHTFLSTTRSAIQTFRRSIQHHIHKPFSNMQYEENEEHIRGELAADQETSENLL